MEGSWGRREAGTPALVVCLSGSFGCPSVTLVVYLLRGLSLCYFGYLLLWFSFSLSVYMLLFRVLCYYFVTHTTVLLFNHIVIVTTLLLFVTLVARLFGCLTVISSAASAHPNKKRSTRRSIMGLGVVVALTLALSSASAYLGAEVWRGGRGLGV